jgi:short-subunit dehydrogenase
MTDVAVVTGASSGLGEAIARRLDAEGLHVVLVARRSDRLHELAATLTHATVLACDLVDEGSPSLIRTTVHDLGGRLVLLVNNAGVPGRGLFADIGYEGVRATMEINFDAQLRVTEAVLPLLRASAPATIVNVSSVSGRIARPNAIAYSTSKFALAGWSEALRAEERPHGVNVTLLLPGYIATEGFPQADLLASPVRRRLVAGPQRAADAVVQAWRKQPAEICVPRAWRLAVLARTLLPGLVARAVSRPEMTPAGK